MTDYEKELLNKIDTKHKLTEKELKALICTKEVERIEGDDIRWQRSIQSIVELDGRYFSIDWQQGLTECRKNDFDDQPYEVTKKIYEKTITVTEWNKKVESPK